MNMNRVWMSCLLLCAAPVLAQEDPTLKENAKSAEVSSELESPDGATIKWTEDGGFQVFGTGTGTYDFQDPDDIKDAKQEATLTAKANLAKFLGERLRSDEQFNKAAEKKKTLAQKDGKQSASISKDDVKKTLISISDSADQILRGVIVLEESRTPKGENNGEVRVKVGYSSKTLKMVKEAGIAIDEAGVRSADKGGSVSSSSGQGQGSKGPTGYEKSEKRKADTDF